MTSPPPTSDSFLTRLKKLDVYRTIPQDLTEQTTTGAAISILGAILVLILVLSETAAYLRVDVRHELTVEQAGMRPLARSESGPALPDDGLLQLNFNVTLPRMPCSMLSLAVQDILGGAINGNSQQIRKYRTNHEGTVLRSAVPPYDALSGDGGGTPEQLRREGCSVEGHVRVPRVPGVLMLSTNAHADVLQRFLAQQPGHENAGPPPALNCSHRINALWFGESLALTEVSEAAVAPLNGAYKVSHELTAEERAAASHGGGVAERSYEYFLKIIPTEYRRLSGPPIASYQYVSNSNEVLGRYGVPAIFFRYDVEPVTIRFVAYRQAFADFLVNLCAIVGGVVASLGLMSMGLKAAVKTGIKKQTTGLGGAAAYSTGKAAGFSAR